MTSENKWGGEKKSQVYFGVTTFSNKIFCRRIYCLSFSYFLLVFMTFLCSVNIILFFFICLLLSFIYRFALSLSSQALRFFNHFFAFFLSLQVDPHPADYELPSLFFNRAWLAYPVFSSQSCAGWFSDHTGAQAAFVVCIVLQRVVAPLTLNREEVLAVGNNNNTWRRLKLVDLTSPQWPFDSSF